MVRMTSIINFIILAFQQQPHSPGQVPGPPSGAQTFIAAPPMTSQGGQMMGHVQHQVQRVPVQPGTPMKTLTGEF